MTEISCTLFEMRLKYRTQVFRIIYCEVLKKVTTFETNSLFRTTPKGGHQKINPEGIM